MGEHEEHRAATHNSMSGEVSGHSVQAGSVRNLYIGTPPRRRALRAALWITVLALAAAAAVTLVVLDPFSTTPSGTSTGTAGSSGAPTTEPTPPATSTPAADAVRWTGTVNLTYLDLDAKPAGVLSSNTGASAWVNYDHVREEATLYGSGGGFLTTDPTVARWDGPGEPGPDECRELIATQGVETLPVTEESRFCASTAKGRVAFLDVLAFDPDSDAYKARVKIWDAGSR
ncbi:hypothetical protein [Saccharothrix syringae]|uniref:Uncharacterized protein n=1 Tax=Saccharothrix syringae TaxID=103733 RepID=A0A5Q0H835_SACSY|nr:hypothetical protein [Saccharothrix syringae]QFZ22387.1 hypothetical protein EKG83_37645 [Saccharothrix syringae]